GGGAELLHRAPDSWFIDVGDEQGGLLLREVATEVEADVPQPLDGDPASVQAGPSELELDGGFDTSVGAERGGHRRIAGGAREAGDMPRLQVDQCHVIDGRTDVLGGDVAPAEAFDEPAVSSEDGFPPRRLRVADD